MGSLGAHLGGLGGHLGGWLALVPLKFGFAFGRVARAGSVQVWVLLLGGWLALFPSSLGFAFGWVARAGCLQVSGFAFGRVEVHTYRTNIDLI